MCRLRLSLHALWWLRIKSQTASLKLSSILRRSQKLRLPLSFSLTSRGQGSLRRRVALMLFSTFHSGETKSIVVSELGSEHPTDPPSHHCSAEQTLLWVKHPGDSYLQNLLSSQTFATWTTKTKKLRRLRSTISNHLESPISNILMLITRASWATCRAFKTVWCCCTSVSVQAHHSHS